METGREEGWYCDPYGLHGARWFSIGTPTALVRDGDVEDHDPPPDGPMPRSPERLPEVDFHDGADLRRSGGADKTFDANRANTAAMDVAAWMGGARF